MTFKIAKKPIFTVQVEVSTPNDKCGHDYSTFTAKFLRADADELSELRKLPQKDVMRKKLAGWEDFNDADNNPVEFSEFSLEILINIPEALYGLTLAFWGSVVKAKEKN